MSSRRTSYEPGPPSRPTCDPHPDIFPPEALTALLQKTPAYPGGYLEGGSVPQDAWGQAFVYALSDSGYTLWSIGANGIDDGGAGDDLTVD